MRSVRRKKGIEQMETNFLKESGRKDRDERLKNIGSLRYNR